MIENLEGPGAVPDYDASVPLDPERGLRGQAAAKLIEHVEASMAAKEVKARALSQAAARQRTHTVSCFLSNLVVAALNRINSERYVAVPFNRSRYAELRLSHDAMVLARDTLVALDLIDYHPGVYNRHFIDFMEFKRVSRIRAKPNLRELFDRFGVQRRHVTHRREKLIRLNKPEQSAGPEPETVASSRPLLARINAKLDCSEIALPEDAWARVKDARQERAAARGKAEKLNLPYVGDMTAKALYRVFTGNWSRGGRLYGGWWQSVESRERRHLTIDGEPTVEIDFGHVHPALLYRAMGKELDRDPYTLPPYSRELCKETFQRLINKTANKGGDEIRRPKKALPPEGIPFATFLADYKNHLAAVSSCFGKGVGLILQNEDSELALAVLSRMLEQGVTTLPIHDSFIVRSSHGQLLEDTMRATYHGRYGVYPILKVT